MDIVHRPGEPLFLFLVLAQDLDQGVTLILQGIELLLPSSETGFQAISLKGTSMLSRLIKCYKSSTHSFSLHLNVGLESIPQDGGIPHRLHRGIPRTICCPPINVPKLEDFPEPSICLRKAPMKTKSLRAAGTDREETEMIIQGRSIQPGPMKLDQIFADLLHHLLIMISFLPRRKFIRITSSLVGYGPVATKFSALASIFGRVILSPLSDTQVLPFIRAPRTVVR